MSEQLSGRDLAWLERRRAELFGLISQVGDFRRGALNAVWRKCGKPNCACAQPGHRGHGPQWNLTRRISGKTVNVHLKPGPELEKARAEGPRRRLVSVLLTDPDVMMWGGELLLRDGQPAGQVTSAAWGATVGSAVGLAYLHDPDGGVVTGGFVRSGRYEVNVGGELCPARVGLRAPYDPDGRKIKPGNMP